MLSAQAGTQFENVFNLNYSARFKLYHALPDLTDNTSQGRILRLATQLIHEEIPYRAFNISGHYGFAIEIVHIPTPAEMQEIEYASFVPAIYRARDFKSASMNI